LRTVAVPPQDFNLQKAAYRVGETLDILGIGRTTFYELIAAKRLRVVKCGKRTLILAGDLAKFLDSLRVGAAE
jgi:excisionase family DNA binding protein